MIDSQAMQRKRKAMTILKKLRDEGVNQVWIAERLGVVVSTVASWRNGMSIPNSAYLSDIEKL